MNYFFDDLALPRMLRTQLLADVPEWKLRRAGYVSEGNPTSLHVVRSMRVGLARRIAMGGDAAPNSSRPSASWKTWSGGRRPAARVEILRKRVAELRERMKRVPFLDPFDLRYRNRVREPAHQQGGDVLPDGRLRLHGRIAQGPRQALLHPAVPVPLAPLREDRGGVHPPPHRRPK